MLFEKAWAKLHLSYEATAGGFTEDATSYLTGGIIKKVPLEVGVDNGAAWRECMQVRLWRWPPCNPELVVSVTYVELTVAALRRSTRRTTRPLSSCPVAFVPRPIPRTLDSSLVMPIVSSR
jgi:hypothetical protein